MACCPPSTPTHTNGTAAAAAAAAPLTRLVSTSKGAPFPAVPSSTPSFLEVLESLPDYQASLAAWRYCPPFILVLGTFGNLMILWVLSLSSSSSSSSSMPVFFRALALSDLILLYTGLLRNWIRYTFDVEIRDWHSVVCKVHIFLVYTSNVTSAWFLVMMTTQRALVVVWPHKMRGLHSQRTALLTVGAILLLSCVLNAHTLYGYDVSYHPDSGQHRCAYRDASYQSFMRGPWPWADMSTSSFLPFLFLLTSNTLLMWKVTSSVRDVRTLTNTGSKSQEVVHQRQKMSASLNVTLVFLSATFFFLTSPICVFLVLDHYFNYVVDTDDAEHMAASGLGWAVTNLLWYTNNAINFYLYCLTGSRFRAQVWGCLCCAASSPRQNSPSVQHGRRSAPLSETADTSYQM